MWLVFRFRFVKKILDKVPELVNVQKEDGFAALHLAVINGHEDIVGLILQMVNRIFSSMIFFILHAIDFDRVVVGETR